MGMFKGVGGAKFNEGGVWFKDGNFLVVVDAVKVGETRAGIDFFAIEHTVLRSNTADMKPGTSPCNMHTKDKDPFLGNVNHFCAVVSDTDPEEVTEEGVEMICSDENPMKGVVLRARAKTVKTKAGGDYTKVVYSHINEADVEQLKAMGVELPSDNPIDLDDEGGPFIP